MPNYSPRMTQKISLIVAMAQNRTIGRGNDLPWHIPEDLKYFKTVTSGKPVIMGRKTFDSILARLGKPLPNRPHYVISRTKIDRDDITWCPSLEDAIRAAKSNHPDSEIIIMGGASIYEQAIPLVDRMYLTIVHGDVEGDAWFADFDKNDWLETQKTSSSFENWSYDFVILERKES
ncbi:MAG: dihydrofolate reductase [Alphaproteobacteria bacterium]|nr:dihydrofolate reductase [Alphaproteobacteria bacterium]